MVELVETGPPPLVELVETGPCETQVPNDGETGQDPTKLTGLLIGDLSQRYRPAMPYMYILKCADASYYVDSTWDIERRLAQHESGEGAAYTRRRRPVVLVHLEEYNRVEDAFVREKQVQGWGRAKREALIHGDEEALVALSRSRRARPPDAP